MRLSFLSTLESRPKFGTPVAPHSFLCCRQPWFRAVGGPALRYVGSRRPSRYPTGCRFFGSSVTRLSVSSSRSGSLQSVFRTVCLTDLDGGCGSVGSRPTVFRPAVCSSGRLSAGHRIYFPAVDLIGSWVLRRRRAIRQSALSTGGPTFGALVSSNCQWYAAAGLPESLAVGCSVLVVVSVPGSLFFLW